MVKGVPFSTFVVKVVSRCNLNCSYCYMYNLQDGTWRGQPSVIKPEIVKALGEKISAHTKKHKLSSVHIILHGGEPLLMGIPKFKSFVKTLRKQISPFSCPVFSIQSNGTLVTEAWIEALNEMEVGIGLSVDGPKEFHDAFRRDHKDRGSFEEVIAAIRLLQTHPKGKFVFSNVMAVVNTSIPPKDLFNFWKFLKTPGFDLSLPHANHTHPPPMFEKGIPYGDWLIEFFDLWFDWNCPGKSVRYFENILRVMFGHPFSTDNIGGKPVGVVVVETNGGLEPTDAFKCCEEGITKIGVNVLKDKFDDLYSFKMLQTLQQGSKELCDQCQACPALNICGGGYMPHRYRKENGFDNPTVYCEDIFKLVHHIAGRVGKSLPKKVLQTIAQNNECAAHVG